MSARPFLLILYYSRGGGTANLARHIARGATAAGGFDIRLRTVPPVAATVTATLPPVPDTGAVYCSRDDLMHCSGLALGSPTRFGNMAAPLKHFFDEAVDVWLAQQLVGKPAAVFCSSGSMHGGQESTLLSMMIPLLHHGMVLIGLPYSETALNNTRTGGSPYGASHVSGADGNATLSPDEQVLAEALGRRLARTAARLLNDPPPAEQR